MGKAIDPCKVAIYIRWSTDDQAEGTTLAVQLEGCKAYVLSQGWTVTEELIFVDDGYSGGNLSRPGLHRMRQLIQAGRIDCVVVLKIDRLSRNVVDMVRLVIEEWGDLCYLKSAREAIDTTNHAGRMFFYTLTSFAEWERATIRERTFSGKLKRAQAGRNPGMKAPYGYGTADGCFAVDEREAAVVRRIFERYRTGQGMTQIAHDLNRDGIPHRSRPTWDKTEVQRVLRNPIYVGDFVYGARSRNARYGKSPGAGYWVRNEQPLVVGTGSIPAIVTREVWEQVQRLRAARPSPRKGQSGRALGSQYLLSGLLRCTRCGHAMMGRTVVRTGRQYYVCTGRHGQGATVCDSGHIRVDHLDQHVAALFMARYGRAGERDRFVQEHLAQLAQERRALQQQLASVEADDRRLAETGSRLRREYRAGRINIEELREHAADLKADRAALAARKERLLAALQGLEATARSRQELLSLAGSPDAWAALTPDERKRVLRHFAARIAAYRPRGGGEIACEVTWRVSELPAPQPLENETPTDR